MNIHKTLREVYNSAEADGWQGQLIRDESQKVHDTARHLITELCKILTSPHATMSERSWARKKLDAL